MLEVQNKEYGSVTSDCSCTSSNPTSYPNAFTPTTLLPPECYSPSGDSCYWYRNCLERKYPCEATSSQYAIKYAEHFCKLYDENFGKFSLIGRNWVNRVRKCLQVSLVPLLRPRVDDPSCEEMREKAFASHTTCYLDPGDSVPAVCDLDCSDYFKIFWTIKGSFVKIGTLWESPKGMWNISAKCGRFASIKKCIRKPKDSLVRVTKLEIKKFIPRSRRSIYNLLESDAQSRFADGVASAIASALKWNSDVMDWLAYVERVEAPDNMEIVVLLVDKKALGIAITSTPSVNFNETIQESASAVQKGALTLKVDGHYVWVKSLASCSDKACSGTQTLAMSDKPPNWNGAVGISCGKVVLYGTIAVLIMMMEILLYWKDARICQEDWVFPFIERKNVDLSYVTVVLMVCLTLGFVLNAFELKLFDSLSVAKKLHENVHLASFTIAMLVTNGAIFSCSILDPVMTTNKFWTTKQLTFLELTRKSISNTVANQRVVF